MSNSRNMNDNNKNDLDKAFAEVEDLAKQGYDELNKDLINHLQRKYSDSHIVELILDQFKLRKNKLDKISRHFVKKFQEKYGSLFNQNKILVISLRLGQDYKDFTLPELNNAKVFLPNQWNTILKKLLKYKKKYDLSDDEFDSVKRRFEKKLYNENRETYNVNMTTDNNLSRILGSPYSYSTDVLKPSSNDDFKNIQEIIKQNKLSKPLYSQIIVQTSTYDGNYGEPHMCGHFNIDKHSLTSYIHPVLAALFLHKLKDIEMRMLYSNIAEIVESRYEKKPIDTEPNSRLLYYLVNDPSDIVCSTRSPLDDLRERSSVQIQLWQNVLNLRNGKYYDATSLDFLNVIDKCKISNFDNPDLIMLGDEGVVLRRLFNVFSYRPIVVQTYPIMQFNNLGNPALQFNQYSNPFNNQTINNVISTLPYITFRISSDPTVVATLDVATNFTLFYVENNMFIPKTTNILYVYGPLVFYIPRKSINVPIIQPPSVISLPMTKYSNLKTLNNNVYPPSSLIIVSQNNAEFRLKSIVCINNISIDNIIHPGIQQQQQQQIITGNKTYLFEVQNAIPLTLFVSSYSPFDVLKRVTHDALYNPSNGGIPTSYTTATNHTLSNLEEEYIFRKSTIVVYNKDV